MQSCNTGSVPTSGYMHGEQASRPGGNASHPSTVSLRPISNFSKRVRPRQHNSAHTDHYSPCNAATVASEPVSCPRSVSTREARKAHSSRARRRLRAAAPDSHLFIYWSGWKLAICSRTGVLVMIACTSGQRRFNAGEAFASCANGGERLARIRQSKRHKLTMSGESDHKDKASECASGRIEGGTWWTKPPMAIMARRACLTSASSYRLRENGDSWTLSATRAEGDFAEEEERSRLGDQNIKKAWTAGASYRRVDSSAERLSGSKLRSPGARPSVNMVPCKGRVSIRARKMNETALNTVPG